MRVSCFIALLIAMHVSSAIGCSMDALKALSEEHLERLPSRPEHEFSLPDPPTDAAGGTWQVFERANGTPHSIVIAARNELGQDKLRISFLNRRDFIIVTSGFYYSEMVQEKAERTGVYLMGSARSYYFCDGKLQVSPDTPDFAKVTGEANYWKDWIFRTDELKPDIQRVPQ